MNITITMTHIRDALQHYDKKPIEFVIRFSNEI